jgi:hypothetical protein
MLFLVLFPVKIPCTRTPNPPGRIRFGKGSVKPLEPFR